MREALARSRRTGHRVHVAELPQRFTAEQLGFRETGRGRPAMEGNHALLLEAVWIGRASRRMFSPGRWNSPDLVAAVPSELAPLPLQVLFVACLEQGREFTVARTARLLGVDRTKVTVACNTLARFDLMQITRRGHRTLVYAATATGLQFANVNLPHLRSSAVLGPDDGEHFFRNPTKSSQPQHTRRPSTIEQARETVSSLRQDIARRR